MKRKNRLTLDSLIRESNPASRIHQSVLCEPSIRSICKFKTKLDYFSLALNAAEVFSRNPIDSSSLAKMFEYTEKLPEKEKSQASIIIAKMLIDLPSKLDIDTRERTSHSISDFLSRPSSIRDELGKILGSRKTQKTRSVDQGQLFLSWLQDEVGLPNDGKSRVFMIHEGRDGSLKKIEAIPKSTYEKMRDSLFGPIPRKRFMRLITAASLVLVAAFAFTGGDYIVRNSSTIKIGNRKYSQEDIKKEFQTRIEANLNNPAVGFAVKNAISKHPGSLNIQQAFDVYDYIMRKVNNSNTSDGILPRDPHMTLTGLGDCRAKSLLLSTMLEYLGGETVIVWLPPLSAGPGHMYGALKVSKFSSGKKSDEIKMLIADALLTRYGEKANNPQFIDFIEHGLSGTYLVLDATFPSKDNAAPGQFPTNIEYGAPIPFVARPSIEGKLPSVD